MKSRKIMMIGVSIAVVLCIVGCTVKQKEDTKQDKTNVSSSIKVDKKAIKQKQLAILKEHEQEIVDFVKAQNPKVESVQIYWDETEWGVAGNGTPQGGDEMILIFGGFNQNSESSWRVDVVVEDGKNKIKDNVFGPILKDRWKNFRINKLIDQFEVYRLEKIK